MLTYRTRRINRDGHYRYIIEASINGGAYWIIVTNMEGLAPLYYRWRLLRLYRSKQIREWR